MAFNITNLVNAINAKSATVGADSALDKAVLLASNVKNALIYSSLVDLPTADSSNQGDLVRIGASFGADTNYYVSHRDRWNLIDLSDTGAIVLGQYRPFQGTNYGFVTGGSSTDISKFPFASDGNATDLGDLTQAAALYSGQSSGTHGYCTNNSGGNKIEKFPFTSNENATDIGDLPLSSIAAGGGQSSSTHGYNAGGRFTYIQKFSFTTDGDATANSGGLALSTAACAGQSDAINAFGYATGGGGYNNPNVVRNDIQKFSFASEAAATDIGSLTQGRFYMSGQSSETHGYTTGGQTGIGPTASVISDRIDKFSFSSNGNATDVGNLLQAKYGGSAGQSSTVSGYTSGGSPTTYHIEKFPFSTDADATDVGDLVTNRVYMTGHQY
jgi:hypothetical protein